MLLFIETIWCENIGVARGDKGAFPPQIFGNIVILCFEMRFSKQNSVIRLKSYIWPKKKFLGWLRHCVRMHLLFVVSPACKPENVFKAMSNMVRSFYHCSFT